ncbi:MAG: hypothetical protein M3Q71_00790 [Chloroflexota bacterium]|nr:hypothetical protein [Chloroflexota bacterium]MDP9469194.1 hypothetical protein [Chloroflexota bacterium]
MITATHVRESVSDVPILRLGPSGRVPFTPAAMEIIAHGVDQSTRLDAASGRFNLTFHHFSERVAAGTTNLLAFFS